MKGLLKYYRSVPGKRPWALKHTSRFWPAWALTRDISIRLYRSCYIDPLKWGTWTLARDTTVITLAYYHGIFVSFHDIMWPVRTMRKGNFENVVSILAQAKTETRLRSTLLPTYNTYNVLQTKKSPMVSFLTAGHILFGIMIYIFIPHNNYN